MKILLTAINAKYIHSNLAIFSLKACSGQYEKYVQLAEFTINNQKDYILQEIYKAKPDVLCLSCYIWNLEYIESVAREFHKLAPEVPIWVGGPEVSYEVDAFLQEHDYITGVMIGEGEDTFRELCGHYVDGKPSLEDINGIAYKEQKDNENWEVYFTSPREIMDMSSIPFCYNSLDDFSNRIIYYESSRGCPFSCSYCLSSVDKRLRFRDLELVKKELKFFIDQRVPQIKFVDRTFNCNHNHAMEIWKFVKENDNGITNFHFEISADLINEEELQLISDMRPGLIQLEIGVQSTNEVTIKEIHRTMKLERLKEIVGKIQAFGNIHEHLDLIAGLPYENYESFAHSFDEIYSLKPDELQLGFLKVLKGSYMYEHRDEYGIIYHDCPPYEVLRTNWLSFEDVLNIKQVEEMLEVYYNSGQYEVTMKLLDVIFDSAFDMFRQMGQFYEENALFGMNHSRIKRSEILLDFVKGNDKTKEHVEMIEQALVFDLYYRENCKSRPAWAKDIASFKHMTHLYCKNGKVSHVEPFDYEFPAKGERTVTALPTKLTEAIWVLFHYDKRNPLDNQAEYELVSYVEKS